MSWVSYERLGGLIFSKKDTLHGLEMIRRVSKKRLWVPGRREGRGSCNIVMRWMGKYAW